VYLRTLRGSFGDWLHGAVALQTPCPAAHRGLRDVQRFGRGILSFARAHQFQRDLAAAVEFGLRGNGFARGRARLCYRIR
jgi:hypothetical protein